MSKEIADFSVKSNLQVAAEIIYGDREKTHGSPDKNLKTIATYWSTHIKQSHNIDMTLTMDDVCAMMIFLKLARIGSNPNHQDSWIDIAGYVGLQDRCSNGT